MTDSKPDAGRARILGMMQGYRDTSLVRAGVELGVFDGLAEAGLDPEVLAKRLDVDARGLTILLNALVATGLMEHDSSEYRLSPDAARYLVSARPGYVGHLTRILASDWEWDALKLLHEAVRHGGAVVDTHAETPNFRYWEDFAKHATLATGPTAELVADRLAPWLSTRDSVDVLDVACGHGIYGFTLARREPRARVRGLDWDNVVPIARRNAEEMGVDERVDFLIGDMFTTDLGGPYDVALITNVLHHFSQEDATTLLKRVGEATKPDGRVVVVGFTVGDQSPDRDPAPHLFSLLMLTWTRAGEVHSERVYREMFAQSGFARPEIHTVPGTPMRVLIAERA
jgi:2-polyprenyl-3-methyl-5-hydroxy-6-metoxy-1,4-benzoquinol methylase